MGKGLLACAVGACLGSFIIGASIGIIVAQKGGRR